MEFDGLQRLVEFCPADIDRGLLLSLRAQPVRRVEPGPAQGASFSVVIPMRGGLRAAKAGSDGKHEEQCRKTHRLIPSDTAEIVPADSIRWTQQCPKRVGDIDGIPLHSSEARPCPDSEARFFSDLKPDPYRR